MEHVIVERVLPEPVDLVAFERLAQAGQGCFEARRIRLVRSYVSRDSRRVICEYEAPDAEAVRTANQLAGLPFERVWTARVVEPTV
jgi:hypothetical protein